MRQTKERNDGISHEAAPHKKEFALFMGVISIILTVVGTWIGTGRVSLDPIRGFFFKWPRNFSIAFGVELIIAQPIARFVMLKLHQRHDAQPQENDASRV